MDSFASLETLMSKWLTLAKEKESYLLKWRTHTLGFCFTWHFGTYCHQLSGPELNCRVKENMYPIGLFCSSCQLITFLQKIYLLEQMLTTDKCLTAAGTNRRVNSPNQVLTLTSRNVYFEYFVMQEKKQNLFIQCTSLSLYSSR